MNNKSEQEPQISIKLDSGVIQFSLSAFNNILEREITNFILKNDIYKKGIIDIEKLKANIKYWKSKFKNLETKTKVLYSIIERLKRDLKIDKFAQPQRCMASSVYQNVKISESNKLNKVNAHRNSNNEHEILTISDSEDELVVISDTSKIKLQTQNEKIVDLIDSDNGTQNLNVKYKPCPKSKTNFPVPAVRINGNDKVLSINTEFVKSSTIKKPMLSTLSLPKLKFGPKSKTMFVDDTDPSDAVNNETVNKKIRLNNYEVINNDESNSTNVSVNKLKDTEKYNHNFCSKFLSPKYPPPYPLIPPNKTKPSWKNVPPIPNMTINTSGNKVTLIWDLNLTWQTADIKMYELFVCQETDAHPDISMWKKKGNIEADLLPMACELEVFELGFIYYFALRAVDVHNRRTPFALQKIMI